MNFKFYGQELKSDRVKTNDVRAEFELKLTKRAIERNIPILGICNGLQVINVVLGGTLIQHIPDYYKSHINHEQPHPKHEPSTTCTSRVPSRTSCGAMKTRVKKKPSAR